MEDTLCVNGLAFDKDKYPVEVQLLYDLYQTARRQMIIAETALELSCKDLEYDSVTNSNILRNCYIKTACQKLGWELLENYE